ncbi:MAG: ATP-dependent RecD-like DNA helicase [Anaerolineae bacterium]
MLGTVERVVFANEENGYTIARFLVRGRYDLLTIVGNMAGVRPGAQLRVWGQWKNHPTYGQQFAVERYKEERPATVEGMRKYLGSGLIKGIGPVTASRITEHFGLYTLEVIEEDVTRLNEVTGVGPKRVSTIAQAWEAQKSIKEIMLFLQSHNVSTRLAVKIYKTYHDDAIQVVSEDPYRLARDVYGIGFITADGIARNIGIAADSPARIRAGLEHTLKTQADEGHVYLPRPRLAAQAAKLLELPPGAVEPEIDALAAEERLVLDAAVAAEGVAVYLTPFYRAEVGLARRLLALQQPAAGPGLADEFKPVDWARAADYIAQKDGLSLAPQQLEAVKTALTNRVSLLTGGPGTGKTTTIRAILRLLAARKRRVLLAAPTGRAAKRMAEATGHNAKTIHRLLEVDPGEGFTFKRNQDNPLHADMLIVDEVSMIDLILMNNLVKAVGPGMHLLLVGDADQLPPVGAGNVLRDLLASEWAPTIRLKVIFRQAQTSTIITNAHRVNHGKPPLFPENKSDFYFFGKTDPDEAAPLLVDIVADRVPRKFGADPRDDIQVLCPMHRGSAGVGNLNRLLQARLNPPGEGKTEYQVGGRLYREGDKVLQLRNNYDKEVFNGDVGFINALDLENGTATLNFDGRAVDYDLSDLDEVTLAYAMSVHKSQGSEYPVVVMPVLTQHYVMLQRNLLYTAITRAKHRVILVGARKAIAIAVHNNRVDKRWSGLARRLQGG